MSLRVPPRYLPSGIRESRFFLTPTPLGNDLEDKSQHSYSEAVGRAMHQTDLALNEVFQPFLDFFNKRIQRVMQNEEDLFNVCTALQQDDLGQAPSSVIQKTVPLNDKYTSPPSKMLEASLQLETIASLVNYIQQILNQEQAYRDQGKTQIQLKTLNQIIDAIVMALASTERSSRIFGKPHSHSSMIEFDGDNLSDPLSKQLYQMAKNICHRIINLHGLYHQQALLQDEGAADQLSDLPPALPPYIHQTDSDGKFLTKQDHNRLSRATVEGYIIYLSRQFRETFFEPFLSYANRRMKLSPRQDEGIEQPENSWIAKLYFWRSQPQPQIETPAMLKEKVTSNSYSVRQPFAFYAFRNEQLTKERLQIIAHNIESLQALLKQPHESISGALSINTLKELKNQVNEIKRNNTQATFSHGKEHLFGNPLKGEGTFMQSQLDIALYTLENRTDHLINQLKFMDEALNDLFLNEDVEDEKNEDIRIVGSPLLFPDPANYNLDGLNPLSVPIYEQSLENAQEGEAGEILLKS